MTGLPLKARLYWVLVVGAGLACAALFVPQAEFRREFLVAWALLAGLTFLAEVYEVEILPHQLLSTGVALVSAAVFIGGAPLAILTVALGSLAAEIVVRWKKLTNGPGPFFSFVAFNVCQLVVSASVAGLVFQASGGHAPPYTVWNDFVPPILAFVAYVITNNALVGGIIHLTGGPRFLYQLWFLVRRLHVQLLTLGVLAILVAIVYPLSPWYILLVGSPLMVVQISIRGYARLRQQARKTFERLATIVGQRDTYTGTHSAEVAELAVKLARALRLANETVEQIEAAAHVHDLGKVAVPDSILLKPGPLTEDEWVVIKRHPVVGAELLQGLEIYGGIVDIVRHEHEHWDGGGYPDGLAGEKIPLGSRVLAVADVWDALLTDRPYRPAHKPDAARTIMREMAGKTLEPKLVDLFLTIVG